MTLSYLLVAIGSFFLVLTLQVTEGPSLLSVFCSLCWGLKSGPCPCWASTLLANPTDLFLFCPFSISKPTGASPGFIEHILCFMSEVIISFCSAAGFFLPQGTMKPVRPPSQMKSVDINSSQNGRSQGETDSQINFFFFLKQTLR